MHSVLFVASIPEDVSRRHDWAEFVTRANRHIQTSTDAVPLAENVWLLNLEQDIAPLGWLISIASEKKLAFGILPFEHKPQWLPAGFYPETMAAQSGRRP
jgi:hypothetical protein